MLINRSRLVLTLCVPCVKLNRKARHIAWLRFVPNNIAMIEPHGFLGDIQSWDVHDFVEIQVSEKLVPVLLHDLDFLLEPRFVDAQMFQELSLEISRRRYDFAPVMLSFRIGKEFAPFEHADVDEIPIRRAPEVTSLLIIQEMSVFRFLSDTIISEIYRKISAQYDAPA
jgi:hypothetical protein